MFQQTSKHVMFVCHRCQQQGRIVNDWTDVEDHCVRCGQVIRLIHRKIHYKKKSKGFFMETALVGGTCLGTEAWIHD